MTKQLSINGTMQQAPGSISLLQVLYDRLVELLSWIAAPWFILRPRQRDLGAQRYGFWPAVEGEVVWLHGASFGELQGLLPLLHWIREHYPERRILVTATNPRAFSVVKEHCDFYRLLPLDCQRYLRRALDRLTPLELVVTETEIWPGLLRYLSHRGIKVSLVNARISERSQRAFGRWAAIFAPAFATFSKILIADSPSAERFKQLRIPAERLALVGNTKYDRVPRYGSSKQQLQLRSDFGVVGRKVVVLGSLRPAEELPWIEALRLSRFLDSGSVIIAPRHPEYFDYFWERFCRLPWPAKRWSAATGDSCPLLLLDKLGELEKAYAVADLAFVGGTLDPSYGGHNLLEPAMYGCATICGPHGGAIAEVREEMQRAQACQIVRTSDEIAAVVKRLLHSDEDLLRMGQRAREVWMRFSGATERIVRELAWR